MACRSRRRTRPPRLPAASAQEGAAPAQPPGGGCLVATAAYGTELAPQVQLLREARGGAALSGAGAPAMGALHAAYYAFSPAAADMQRGHPELREAARIALSPALRALQAAAQAGSGA